MIRSAFKPKAYKRKCVICKTPVITSDMKVKWCGIAHGAEYAQQLLAKKKAKDKTAERRIDTERKAKLKTRSDWIKDAQHAFNAYIRERDQHQRCICCDLPLGLDAVGGGYDCGHYRSVGSAPHLRFDERNAHAQRKQCNRYGAGRAVDYRLGLIRRLGLATVEALEADNTAQKWSVDQLKEIRDTYRAKLKHLQAAQTALAA